MNIQDQLTELTEIIANSRNEIAVLRKHAENQEKYLAELVSNAKTQSKVLREMQFEFGKFIELVKGQPFAALHTWIIQSQERDKHSMNLESQMLKRWGEHKDALLCEIERLKGVKRIRDPGFMTRLWKSMGGRVAENKEES